MADDIVTRLRDCSPPNPAWCVWCEAAAEIVRLRAVLDAIDALHTSYEDGTEQVCHECYGLWPCRTHLLIYPKEADGKCVGCGRMAALNTGCCPECWKSTTRA